MGARRDIHSISSLVVVIFGHPIAVDAALNPFQNRPEDLNEHMCYLVRSDQIGDSDVGSWKPIWEPRQLTFPDLPIVCREITWGFLDGDNWETEWKMLQYNITTARETFSLCKIGKHRPSNHAQVGGPVPLDNYPRLTDNYTFPAATGNMFESNIFSTDDFMELKDLDFPLFP